MKTPARHLIGRFGLTFLFLFAALFWSAGCATHPDPLAGWHRASKNPDQPIVNDYQDYIQHLSPKEKNNLGPSPASYFEDGTGQHAIRIKIGINGKEWEHILIYDKDNKRIRVIKYVAGHYMS
jgi:hypothetical protein